MASSKKSDDVVARGADVPLALAASGPRDALIDPREGDIVPDIDSKGLHVGEVRQPAEPVLKRGGDVVFESTTDRESKFAPATYAAQVAANSAWEHGKAEYAGRAHVAPLTDPAEIAAAKEKQLAAAAPSRSRGRSGASAPADSSGTGSSEAGTLDAKADAVADAQAAEDKSDK